MIVRSGRVDWKRFTADVLADGTAAAVWFGLSCAADLLNAPVPVEVLENLRRPAYVWPARFLRWVMNAAGGPLVLPTSFRQGVLGRLFEAVLEGRPTCAWRLFSPLVFPSRGRVEILGKGSYVRYYLNRLAS
jgi:hypothetical protein